MFATSNAIYYIEKWCTCLFFNVSEIEFKGFQTTKNCHSTRNVGSAEMSTYVLPVDIVIEISYRFVEL